MRSRTPKFRRTNQGGTALLPSGECHKTRDDRNVVAPRQQSAQEYAALGLAHYEAIESFHHWRRGKLADARCPPSVRAAHSVKEQGRHRPVSDPGREDTGQRQPFSLEDPDTGWRCQVCATKKPALFERALIEMEWKPALLLAATAQGSEAKTEHSQDGTGRFRNT